MKIFLPGETLSVICPDCGRHEGTFSFAPFSMRDGVVVQDVLQCFCNRCGTSVAIAPQSAARIKQARVEETLKITSVRLPLVLWDVAASLVLRAGGQPGPNSPEQVLMAFLSAWIRQPRKRKTLVEQLRKAAELPVMEQSATQKITLTLNQAALKELAEITKASSFSGLSDVLRSCLMVATDESSVQKELECNLLLGRPGPLRRRRVGRQKASA